MRALYFLPGLFFVLPCTDNFVKVDLRTVSFDIPPQEVGHSSANERACQQLLQQRPHARLFHLADPDQGLGDGGSGRRRVLPHTLSHLVCGQRVQRALIHAAAGSNHPEECAGHQKPGGAAV